MGSLIHRRRVRAIPIGACVLALVAVSGSGCMSKGRWTRADYRLSYEIPEHDPEAPLVSEPGAEGAETPPLSLENVSEKIHLVADNQRHELLGNSIMLFRTSASDLVVEASAIRPPQLDLFGQDLLREALNTADGFVLHIGDACDVSNTLEYALFAWDMRRAPQGWIMAPGNHDGYFMGNVSRKLEFFIQEWNDSAERYAREGVRLISQAMQKDRFVSFYLATLIMQDKEWNRPLARMFGPECEALLDQWSAQQADGSNILFSTFWLAMEQFQETIYRAITVGAGGGPQRLDLTSTRTPGSGPGLRRIAWQIDVKEPWKSYVSQELDITAKDQDEAAPIPISILVLDTAQYKYQPAMENAMLSTVLSMPTTLHFTVQLAGTHGNILEEQEESLQWMTHAMMRENRRWIVASHHSYAALGRNTPPRFDPLRDAGGIPVTLSAHTHTGEIRWHTDNQREGEWLEINLGSILDAPEEFRDFQVQRAGDRLAVVSHRHEMAKMLFEQGLFADDLSGYRPRPGDPDDYMTYQRGLSTSEDESELAVKRVLLAAYERMFRLFDSDEPDQGGTQWPLLEDGTTISSHAEVLAEIQRMLANEEESVEVITRMLYDLREYDRTRRVSDATRRKLRVYRLSQSLWAAAAEYATKIRKSPEVDPDISFILLPRPALPGVP